VPGPGRRVKTAGSRPPRQGADRGSAGQIPEAALRAAGPDRWRIDPVGATRVPGVVFGSKTLIDGVEPQALRQVINVASLPGIVDASYAMPDVH
jgi:hypothetical protein